MEVNILYEKTIPEFVTSFDLAQIWKARLEQFRNVIKHSGISGKTKEVALEIMDLSCSLGIQVKFSNT